MIYIQSWHQQHASVFQALLICSTSGFWPQHWHGLSHKFPPSVRRRVWFSPPCSKSKSWESSAAGPRDLTAQAGKGSNTNTVKNAKSTIRNSATRGLKWMNNTVWGNFSSSSHHCAINIPALSHRCPYYPFVVPSLFHLCRVFTSHRPFYKFSWSHDLLFIPSGSSLYPIFLQVISAVILNAAIPHLSCVRHFYECRPTGASKTTYKGTCKTILGLYVKSGISSILNKFGQNGGKYMEISLLAG